MFLMELHERIKKKPDSELIPGYVDKVFEYYNKTARDESGYLPVIIKLEPEEKKKKKSIN
jgi:hypothetical protein